jgi:hypothetical protein
MDYHAKMRARKYLLRSRTYASLMALALKNGKYLYVQQLLAEVKAGQANYISKGREAPPSPVRIGIDRLYTLAATALAHEGKFDEMVKLLEENVTMR